MPPAPQYDAQLESAVEHLHALIIDDQWDGDYQSLLKIFSEDDRKRARQALERAHDRITRQQKPRAVALPEWLVDRFTLVNRIGHGGMANVFLVTDSKSGKNVALKVIHDGQHLGRFRQEASLLQEINSSHIVKVHDFVESTNADSQGAAIVMDYVEGPHLGQLIRRREQPAEFAEVIKWMTGIAQAMIDVSRESITHRDIKPSNILIREAGNVALLADFGLATDRNSDEDITSSRADMTKAGTVLGTASYMSPEQVRDSKAADVRNDIYGFGATFYHVCTGTAPHVGEDWLETLYKVRHEPLTSPLTHNPSIPLNLVRILETALAKKARDRFQTFEELKSQLERELDRIRWNQKLEEFEAALKQEEEQFEKDFMQDKQQRQQQVEEEEKRFEEKKKKLAELKTELETKLETAWKNQVLQALTEVKRDLIKLEIEREWSRQRLRFDEENLRLQQQTALLEKRRDFWAERLNDAQERSEETREQDIEAFRQCQQKAGQAVRAYWEHDEQRGRSEERRILELEQKLNNLEQWRVGQELQRLGEGTEPAEQEQLRRELQGLVQEELSLAQRQDALKMGRRDQDRGLQEMSNQAHFDASQVHFSRAPERSLPTARAPSMCDLSISEEIPSMTSSFAARRRFDNGKELQIVVGDIVEQGQTCEVIVSSDDGLLRMNAGVSNRIKQVAGPVVQEEAQRFAPVQAGRAIATSAGKLPQRMIFHGITLALPISQMEGNYIPTTDLIRNILDSCCYHIESSQIKSIIFPLLGTGIAGMDAERCLKTMVDYLVRELEEGITPLQEARIVVLPNVFEQLGPVIERLL